MSQVPNILKLPSLDILFLQRHKGKVEALGRIQPVRLSNQRGPTPDSNLDMTGISKKFYIPTPLVKFEKARLSFHRFYKFD
jgi:hypothetical protein